MRRGNTVSLRVGQLFSYGALFLVLMLLLPTGCGGGEGQSVGAASSFPQSHRLGEGDG